MNHSEHLNQASKATSVFDWFSQQDFMPHGHCYLWKPGLVWTHVISDILIGLAYFSISLTLYGLVKKIKLPFTTVVLSFGVFIGACGLTHLMEVWNLWNADYWWSAWVKVLTAFASVTTGIYLYRLRQPILTVAEAAKLSEQRRLDLEGLTKDLETRVEERTLELTNAIETRDNFLSIASHELNTPLTSLRLQSQLLEKKISENPQKLLEDVRKYLLVVNRQTDRISRLVNDMLDVSRIQAGKLQIEEDDHEICAFLKEVIERFCTQGDAQKCKILLRECTPVSLRIDAFKLEQVIINLLTNAMKYAPLSEIEINVHSPDRNNVRITVSDKGSGIASENLEKIFSRFERAVSASEVSGLGLGLYISRQIIELHGGRIWAESEQGQGATFIIELPVPHEII